MEAKENVIIKLTFQFSLEVITYCECLNDCKKFVIANQLLKSGTSIGANIGEAQNAESKVDFIHKFKIAAKKLKKQYIGWNYVSFQKIIRIQMTY